MEEFQTVIKNVRGCSQRLSLPLSNTPTREFSVASTYARTTVRTADLYRKNVFFISFNWLTDKLVETLDHENPQFYPGVYVDFKTLLTISVSTRTAEHSFSSMKRLKISSSKYHNGRESSILHIYKHKDVDIDGSIKTEFSRLKGIRLALCL